MQEIPGQQEALETLQNARQRLNETMTSVKQRHDEACEYTDQVVRANPWSSVGIGFGVGILVGALVTLAASSRSGALGRVGPRIRLPIHYREGE